MSGATNPIISFVRFAAAEDIVYDAQTSDERSCKLSDIYIVETKYMIDTL